MATTVNSKKNAGAFKGLEGAYLLAAPAGTALPTSVDSELGSEFKNLGFVSSDGITFTDEAETSEQKDLNGDVVDSGRTGMTSKMSCTLIEAKAAAYEVLYGAGNVSDASGTLTVKNTGEEPGHHVFVLDGKLKGGRRIRRVMPDGQCVSLGEQKAVSTDLFARSADFQLYKDDVAGFMWVDYIASTETAGA